MSGTETCHFWVAWFRDDVRRTYFKEVHDVADKERQRMPLSSFARDQGEKWYDHDALEIGFRESETSYEQWWRGHSWSDQWTAEVMRRIAAAGISDINSINSIFYIEEGEIKQPRSVNGDGYILHYLGTIKLKMS
jgi:Immunity protein 22